MRSRDCMDTQKLEEALREMKKPSLSAKQKQVIKMRLMERTNSSVVFSIKKVVADFGLSLYKKAKIKERVFALIEDTPQKRFAWSTFFGYTRRAVGAMMLVVMTMGVFSFLNLDVNTVRAETFTVLDEYTGEVFVQRDGEFLEIEEGMKLQERDRVLTGVDGLASITFFDDSVSRLDNGTEVTVNKLFRPGESSMKSYVEVSLAEGMMWSRVVNLVERTSSFVVEVEHHKVYASTQKGAFNIMATEDDLEIDVYNNEVNVRNFEGEERVVSGQKAVLNNQKIVKVAEIEEESREIAWVQENLADDKLHLTGLEERLLAAKMESVGVEDIDDVSTRISFLEETKLFLTADDVKKKKLELDLAHKSFTAGGLILSSDEEIDADDIAEAEESITEYEDTVKDFYQFVEEVEIMDSEYAQELEEYAEEKIMEQKRNLSSVLPDSPSYRAKEVVSNLELLVAEDKEELIEIKKDQSKELLADVEEVVENGVESELEAVVDEYKKGVEDVIEATEVADREELVEEIEKDLQLLDNIGVETYGIEFEGDKALSPFLRR